MPQAEKLTALRRAVEATSGKLPPFFDDMYLKRFLRARGHDVERAKAMFLAHLAWRKENEVDSLLEKFHFKERDAVLSIYPQGYHKTDKQGRPIYIQHLGQVNLKTLTSITTEERMLQYHIQEYERCLRYIFPICSKIAGHQICTTFTILDLKGVGLRHLTGETKRILNKIVDIDSNNYPETLGQTLIINAPSVFKMLWSVVKPMLDVRTQAKVKVASSNYMPELLKYVDIENIPAYLGGKSKGSLVDDVGPWQIPQLVAEVEAEAAARDGRAVATPKSTTDEGTPLAGAKAEEPNTTLELGGVGEGAKHVEPIERAEPAAHLGPPARPDGAIARASQQADGAAHAPLLRQESAYLDAVDFIDAARRDSMSSVTSPSGETSVYSSPRGGSVGTPRIDEEGFAPHLAVSTEPPNAQRVGKWERAHAWFCVTVHFWAKTLQRARPPFLSHIHPATTPIGRSAELLDPVAPGSARRQRAGDDPPDPHPG